MNAQESRIHVFFHLRCEPSEAESIARGIALEQTVEVPESLVTPREIMETIVGRIESIEPLNAAQPCFRAEISYNANLSAFHIPQTLNLLYGNISIKNNIKIVGIEFPADYLERFAGPRHGIDGIRERLGVHGRPLLATALKPQGSSDETFARMARDFALGGGDIVKDDHNLSDLTFERFCERALRCHNAVEEANASTGRNAMYFPNIIAPDGEIERQLEWAARSGIQGVLISPFAVGLEKCRALAERYPLVFMAHPSFSGTFFHDPFHGIEPGTLLGQIFRILGMDVSIYPNHGGRFGFTPEDCHSINFHLREELGRLKPSFPAPAGGMRFERLSEMAEEYGADTIYLIGGGLLSYSGDLRSSTAAFLDKVREFFEERLEAPQRTETVSSCELPQPASAAAETGAPGLQVLRRMRETGSWSGREPVEYKATDELPFKDVRRVELIGKGGEECGFEARYFEIAPGGYTSLEKHRHTHTVICASGTGVLLCGDERIELGAMDIAYVPPMAAHQLRNESGEAFGFYCIVDKHRDRPMAP